MTRETSRRSILAGLALSAAAPPARAQQRRRAAQDFEGAAVGAPPPGFSFALTGGGPPPRWMVLEDSSSPAGPRVLAETSRDRTDTRFPLAVLDGFEARDVTVAVRLGPVDGRRLQFAGADARVPRDRWQALGLAVRGDRFEISLDGRTLFGAADRTFSGAGRVALWTKADSLTHFDAFEAEELA